MVDFYFTFETLHLKLTFVLICFFSITDSSISSCSSSMSSSSSGSSTSSSSDSDRSRMSSRSSTASIPSSRRSGRAENNDGLSGSIYRHEKSKSPSSTFSDRSSVSIPLNRTGKRLRDSTSPDYRRTRRITRCDDSKKLVQQWVNRIRITLLTFLLLQLTKKTRPVDQWRSERIPAKDRKMTPPKY